MSDISPIGTPNSGVPPVASTRTTATVSSNGSHTPTDSLELSATAQLLSKLADLPDVREDLVADIRQQIAAGTYESQAKFDAAFDAMIDDVL